MPQLRTFHFEQRINLLTKKTEWDENPVAVNEIKQILAAATLKILHPIVRVLLKHGVSHTEFSELARKAYVDVAFKDFRIEGRKQTVSRVAVLTGLSRKEVVRLQYLADAAPLAEKGTLNRAARVITGWTVDPEFRDAQGQPLPLPSTGEGASFATLIKRYSGDITAGAILDELVYVGAVELKDELLFLCTQAYVPRKSELEKLKIMGICAADFLNTIEHNVSTPHDDARFQRALIYHDLPRDVVDEFKTLSSEKANALLLELNQWLAGKARVTGKSPLFSVRLKTGLGIYYFEDKDVKEKTNEA